MKTPLILAVICGAALFGCTTKSYLNQRTTPERADYGDNSLPVPPSPTSSPRMNMINPDPMRSPTVLPDAITGTWTFTVPRTVTRVERRTQDYSQFSLYNGVPAPADTPFVLITVSPDPRSIAESEPTAYHITNHREYPLNGNIAKEWTGNKATGEGFCELLVSKPAEGGDLCHAMAVAKTDEERQMSLEILASITWTSSRVGPASQGSEALDEMRMMQAAVEAASVEREGVAYRFIMGSDGIARCVAF